MNLGHHSCCQACEAQWNGKPGQEAKRNGQLKNFPENTVFQDLATQHHRRPGKYLHGGLAIIWQPAMPREILREFALAAVLSLSDRHRYSGRQGLPDRWYPLPCGRHKRAASHRLH